MSEKAAKGALKFRKLFELADKNVLRWFPGHMDKGMKQMQSRLIGVDCVVEVHDARIPLSGRNPTFRRSIGGDKPYILVLNKMDLADRRPTRAVAERLLEAQGVEHVVYTNGRDQHCRGLRRLFALMQDAVRQSERYHRAGNDEHSAMIIGVPNVGKSSIINMIRSVRTDRGCGTKVGAVAGITRGVLGRIRLSDDPPVSVYDTPGILTPDVSNVRNGLKLALCSCLPDHLVGEDIIADYLLFHLNAQANFRYVELMGLDAPTDHIAEVLTKGAVKLGLYKKLNINHELKMFPDFIRAARHMIRAFREGELGRVFLDYDMLNPQDDRKENAQRNSLS